MNPILQIKDRLSILDVVSTYVRVEKSGNQYKARCPFHNEKTPSFYISPSRNSYHCFGCSKGGDIFSFIEDIEHIPFREALKLLADRAGVELSDYKKTDTDNSLFEILESAVLFFEETLKRNPEVILYVRDRGIFPETSDVFSIGYAPNEWRKLYEHLKKAGFADESIEKSGLCIQTPKGYYDRFRGRVMFPIKNPGGKTVGFTGRILPSIEKNLDKPTAKYVNTPETELYHKSKVLFGYDIAKKSIVEKDLCIVVEGQMDVIMTHQAGSTNTIAVSGTAFTEEQVSLIKRLTSKVALCFDTDSAGLAALKRSASLALLQEMDVYVLPISGAKDPAELIQENSDAWHTAVESKVHVVEFLLDHYKQEIADEREYSQKVSKEILPIVASIVDKIDQSHFIGVIASRLNIAKESVESSLKSLGTNPIIEKETQSSDVVQNSKLDQVIEHLIGLIYLQEAESRSKYTEISQKLLEDIPGESLLRLEDFPEDIINKYVISAEATYKDTSKHVEEIEKLLLSLQETVLEKKLSRIQEILKSGAGEVSEASLAEQFKIAKELDIIRKKRHTHT